MADLSALCCRLVSPHRPRTLFSRGEVGFRSRRVAARARHRRIAWRLAELQSASFSFLALDCPRHFSDRHKLGQEGLSVAQRTAFDLLVSTNLRFGRLRPEASGRSRGLATFSALLSDFETRWTSQHERPGASIDVSPGCTALPVDPARVQVPDKAGILDPASVLPEPQRSQFLGLGRRVMPELMSLPVPKFCYRVDTSDDCAVCCCSLAWQCCCPVQRSRSRSPGVLS